ncbi:hypothetical protein GCT13_39455 [Paraburkholderia sp. CNPSo 3157]|uniref:Uncharacterized protein n=1 Tax=Paraburkholderia franconis TaxID=2654983 RepID=A0A7X1TKT5_9BURK|nr:hypothetical protein [Paraburkholderia franconis]MPW22724.1 hypothetical protein [Paraburkholderia franconis]
MKHTIAVLIAATLGLASLGVGAQNNSGAGTSAAAEHPDEIVRMHQQVAAANREYDREVAAAKKVYDHKKAEAKRKRDAAISVAHHGASQ